MENLMVFSNELFGNVRTTVVKGKPYFMGKDVAKALEYSDTSDALIRHCSENGVAFCHIIDSLGRKQEAKFISEHNVIRLIMRSKLPKAVEFEEWIVETVIPSILKTGSYSINKDMVTRNDYNKLLSEFDNLRNTLSKFMSKSSFAMELIASNTYSLNESMLKVLDSNDINKRTNEIISDKIEFISNQPIFDRTDTSFEYEQSLIEFCDICIDKGYWRHYKSVQPYHVFNSAFANYTNTNFGGKKVNKKQYWLQNFTPFQIKTFIYSVKSDLIIKDEDGNWVVKS